MSNPFSKIQFKKQYFIPSLNTGSTFSNHGYVLAMAFYSQLPFNVFVIRTFMKYEKNVCMVRKIKI